MLFAQRLLEKDVFAEPVPYAGLALRLLSAYPCGPL
jgi:hypothetical protein